MVNPFDFQVEPVWLLPTQVAVQTLCGELSRAETDDVGTLLDQFTQNLRPPPCRVHAAILSTLLIQVCRGVIDTLHRSDETNPCRCAAVGWQRISELARWYDHDPIDNFRRWKSELLSHFAVEHRPAPAIRAMALIQSAPERRWTLAELARAVETSPAQLRTAFVARYDIAPLAYLQRARAIRALTLLKNMKVEAVAWEVGYRSKKDLYRALREWTGHQPKTLRGLTDQEIESLTTRVSVRRSITNRIAPSQ